MDEDIASKSATATDSSVHDLLEAFRSFCTVRRREGAQDTAAADALAIQLYMKGAELEATGTLGKAMELYSRAFRLDADVECKVDQRLLTTRIQAALAEANGSFQASEHTTQPCNRSLLDTLIRMPNNRHIGHLAALPEDVLQRVLIELGSEHIVALELVARCCRGLYAECRRNRAVWTWLWRHCFACIRTNDALLPSHLQFIALPKLRTDGLYISRITYFRQGYEEGAVYQPFHVVTYYRYLRFWQLSQGSTLQRLAVALVTTDKPAVAIERLRAVPIDAIRAVQSRFPRERDERTSRPRTPFSSRPSTPRTSTPAPTPTTATPNLFVGQYWRTEDTARETTASTPKVSRDFKLRLYDAQSTQPLHLAMHLRLIADPNRHNPNTHRTPPLQCLRYAARRSGAPADERIDFDVGNWSKFHFSRVRSYHT